MRCLFIFSILAFASFSRAAGSDDPAILFLENRVLRDPDDFIAWNQLAEKYHLKLRQTGDDKFIPLEIEAGEKSLKAIPAVQNPDGLAALAQALLTAHRFKEAHAMAEQLYKTQGAHGSEGARGPDSSGPNVKDAEVVDAEYAETK